MDFGEEIKFGCAGVVGVEEVYCPFVNHLVVVHGIAFFFYYFDDVRGRILCEIRVAGGFTQLSLGLMAEMLCFIVQEYLGDSNAVRPTLHCPLHPFD